MIAKGITVKAVFTDNIIKAKAEIINEIVEKRARYQDAEITPSEVDQIVTPSTGYAALEQVVVHAIPSNYGRIDWNGTTLSVY